MSVYLGETVTLTITPNAVYALTSLSVTTESLPVTDAITQIGVGLGYVIRLLGADQITTLSVTGGTVRSAGQYAIYANVSGTVNTQADYNAICIGSPGGTKVNLSIGTISAVTRCNPHSVPHR